MVLILKKDMDMDMDMDMKNLKNAGGNLLNTLDE